MKKLLFIIVLFLAGNIAAQEEKFTYCINGGTIIIEKIDEQHIGDTIIKTFKHSSNNTSTKTFNYYIFNDSIFSKNEGIYYLIGAYQAQIGDIWKPLWYEHFQYGIDTNTLINHGCPLQRSLKVVGIEQIAVGSEFRLKYKLQSLDTLQYDPTPFFFYFIEGIGATSGGLYYNLSWQGTCNPVTDISTPTFKLYETNDYQYIESNCQTTVVSNTEELDNINFKIENNYLLIQGIENESIEILFVDLTGKIIMKVSNQQQINISALKGLVIVYLNTENGYKIVKFNFM